jgi:hypothetical protein
MLKIDRSSRTFSQLDKSTLVESQILERADLQECIVNSGSEFFAEIGEDLFVLGKEVSPSQTVQDRIDLLGVDPEGAIVIVELKRGSNKLQMLQAVSYAGMIARWGSDEFQNLVSAAEWEKLIDFLNVEPEDINRSQRLLLVAEGYDYALLSGAEWLSEGYGVDIRCASVSLATDQDTGAEYLACASIFPPPELADQASARRHTGSATRPLRWVNWEDAISQIENEALVAFVSAELQAGRESYLRKRLLHYRLAGKRRWNLVCRKKLGYVWQSGRFSGDTEFWRSRISEADSVQPVKSEKALRFNLRTPSDFQAFSDAVNSALQDVEWLDSIHEKAGDDAS